MQAARKCVRCNTLNELGQLYCIKCGKYLSRADNEGKSPTIWDINIDKDDSTSVRKTVGLNKQSGDVPRYVVICPQCNSIIPAENGTIPLACDQCGYFFQAGIDKIVPNCPQVKQSSGFLNDRKADGQGTATDIKRKQLSMNQKTGPLARVKKDESSLRLICITINGILPERVKESGDIIGADGTVLKALKTQQQISIWHSATGWYIRSLAGNPLFNGVPINAGMQIKLSDGDMLTVGREQVRVEII